MSAPLSPALPERVLIVRLGAIGDVANALVVATGIRDQRPGVEIGWVVHELAAPLVQDHPAVDRVHVWRRAGGLGALRALARELRRSRYGLALDLQRIQKSALVAALSGAPRAIGFDRRRSKELAWLWPRERLARGDPRVHVVEQYQDFLRHLGLAARARHELPRDPAADAWAAALVHELGAAPIAVALGASKPENRWPPERTGLFARRVALELAHPVCLVGGPADRPLVEAARSALGAAPCVRDLVGRTTLPELVALLRRARVFVGPDTGPMHLAAALGRPVVALFGPASPARTGPWGPGHRVLQTPERTLVSLAVDPVLTATLSLSS